MEVRWWKVVWVLFLVVFVAALAYGGLQAHDGSGAVSPTSPLPGPSDEELRRDIYESAVEACSLFPPRRWEEPIAAAEEYAAGYQEQFQQAAFEGCLDGFRDAGALP